tara:strand:- start:134 stop:382 length:249 start_codon:yes stop_codon:yes gene_type:complete
MEIKNKTSTQKNKKKLTSSLVVHLWLLIILIMILLRHVKVLLVKMIGIDGSWLDMLLVISIVTVGVFVTIVVLERHWLFLIF